MDLRTSRALCASAAIVSYVACSIPVTAQEAASARPASQAPAEEQNVSANEIIVTAQKRSQSINDVPLSITAASGDQLLAAGITSTADLAKIVPGLTAQPSPYNTPIYTLRGVGFFEFSLATPSTVAVYTDEIALPFSAMTKAAALDVEQVEVLKGPQGTLFGQNTTGGAINFVSAKPTDEFKAGADLSYGRFNTFDLQGFISGPLSDTLSARFAARTIQSGDWQKSSSRQDSLGARRETQARLLLDWHPTDRLKAIININGWIDKSNSQAPQRTETFISVPGNPNEAPIRALPPQPLTARSADWSNSRFPMRHDDSFFQASARIDYELTDDITLTSISAYERYKTTSFQDYDGTPLDIADVLTRGQVNSLAQEFRISGKGDGLNWIVGANYSRDVTRDGFTIYPEAATTNYVGPFKGGRVIPENNSKIRTAAIFANAEYEILPRLTLQAGGRYTDNRRANSSCARIDPSAPGFAPIFEFLQTLINPNSPPVPVGNNDCYSLTAAGTPLITPLKANLNEDNISWRAGLNYKANSDSLIYATISKGYKAGSFPTVAPATARELGPVTQKSVLAYELGFKQALLDDALQMNGAIFYYDYADKQLRGRINDPVFGPLDALVQIPQSRVKGAEAQVIVRPVDGFYLNLAATYLNTKIEKFVGFNQTGQLADFSGFRFPFSPKWTFVGDGQYDFAVGNRLDAFVGANVNYNSSTTASIGDIPQLRMKAYTLVDLRVGIQDPDRTWKFSIWGRNIFDTYYWTSANQTQDVFVRYTGKPATYGASFSYRF